MTSLSRSRLHEYEPLQALHDNQSVQLVSKRGSTQIFVLKIREIYDLAVYAYLAASPRPGLPHIESYFEEDGKLIVIEEYISGRSLETLLETHGRLETSQALDIMRQLCEVLAPLHQHVPPIVHRDIKPSNIIIGNNGTVTLIDFNSAKLSYAGQSRDTELFGTSGYAAPEQYGFSVSRPSSDVYALGVVFNQMLIGYLPSQHIHGGTYGEIIRSATLIDPDDRYQDASELLAAIDSVVKRHQPQLQANHDLSGWRIPGFRSGNRRRRNLAIFGYLMIALLTIEFASSPGDTPFVQNLIFALSFAASILFQVFYYADYRGFRSSLPGTTQKNPLLRILMIVFYGFALSFAVLAIVVIILMIVS